MTTAVVIGAGPAGLTAAYELHRLGVDCRVLEADPTYVGGLARTVAYNGYRFDIGGHRFFTKSDEVRTLWRKFLPEGELLSRKRLSRVYYRARFFDYPLRGGEALRKLGPIEAMWCFASYCRARLQRRVVPVSFEDWVVAHFGRRLFHIFFETYTEKVWGMPCSEISADWAAQRIRALSLARAIRHALAGPRRRGAIIKTLIDQFHYPRLGPGQMWEHLANDLCHRGVRVDMGAEVVAIRHANGLAQEVVARWRGTETTFRADHVVSSMPLGAVVRALDPPAPPAILAAAGALRHRDFMTIALILNDPDVFPDNWIYVHDAGVNVARVQNFKNWSPDMVPDPSKTCLGLEYFCSQGDELWTSSDDALADLGCEELARIGLINSASVIDATVVRVPRAYPVYDHDYAKHVATIRSYLAGSVVNLQPCGRNGMHRYNNQDHAMMTGLIAARNVAGESWDQWLVNDDAEYLEQVGERGGGRLVARRLAGDVSA